MSPLVNRLQEFLAEVRKTIGLASRNLLRNRRRSLATLLALAIGSTSILLFGGYYANIRFSMLTAYVRQGGHMQIQHRDYYLYGSGNSTGFAIQDYPRVLQAIQADPELQRMVAVVTPALRFGGLAGNYDAGVSRTIIGNGFEAADINRMRRWNEYELPIIAPEFALDGAPPDAAVVGTGVARVLRLCAALQIADCPQPEVEAPKAQGKAMPSDIAALSALESGGAKAKEAPSRYPKVELLASNSTGTPNVASMQVVRAESQAFKELDEVYVILQLAQAQKLIFGRSPPKVTSIMVQLHRTADMGRARERLEKILAELNMKQPLVVMDFEQLTPFFVQTMQLFRTIFSFIFALIGAIVLFTVGNTMNTVVVERTVEIGTLRAIGLRRSGIRQLFLLEGLLLGVFGAVVGAISALVLSALVNRSGLTWLPPGSADVLPLILRVWGENLMIFGTSAALIIIATASAWWPAYRAARLNVVEALRHV